MATSIMSVPLPESLKAYIEAQVESGDYHTGGDFVRELIQDDLDRHRQALERQLLSGLSSPTFQVPLDQIGTGGLESFLRNRLSNDK